MASARCACGFSEAGDETIDDHLAEVFTPDDGKGPDGKVHLEGELNLFCLCGIGGSAVELDAHLLAVFTPPGHVGRDGTKHERAAIAPSRARDTALVGTIAGAMALAMVPTTSRGGDGRGGGDGGGAIAGVG